LALENVAGELPVFGFRAELQDRRHLRFTTRHAGEGVASSADAVEADGGCP